MKAACLCPQCGTALSKDAFQGLCPSCLLRSGLAAGLEGSAGPRGPFVPPTPGELKRYFPHLEIVELIGQGGMGAVYKARQAKLDRLVALKVLPPEMCKDPAFAERFTREARALARLCHPHIVAVHDFGEVDGLYFFLMEYVDGANLRHILETGRLTPAEALRIVPQVCEALQFAHEEGVVHRDIKPENILLDQKGRVKVADFGLAKLSGPTPGVFTLTGSRQVVGTPHYMAPEQMEKPHTVDHRADIYSLGVVLYEMLTGELPLGRFALPSQKAPVDSQLDDVVLRALAKEPEQRFQRVSEVKESLDGMATPRPAAARPAGQPEFLCIPFFRGITTHVSGLIRWDGRLVVIEMEIKEYRSLWSTEPTQKRYQEVKLPLEDLHSIRLDEGWLLTCLVLRGTRLSVLADIPGNGEGQVSLYVNEHDLADARRLVEETAPLVGRRPVTPPPAAIPVPANPRRGFLGRKVHSLVQKARYWMVDSVLAPRSVLTDLHLPAPTPERKQSGSVVRRVLGATVFNSVLWAVVLCVIGVGTIFMPWRETRANYYGFSHTALGKEWTKVRWHGGGEFLIPKELSLQQIYQWCPGLKPNDENGFAFEQSRITAIVFGCLVFFLVATSSLRSGSLVRCGVVLGAAIAIIVLTTEFMRNYGSELRHFDPFSYVGPGLLASRYNLSHGEWELIVANLIANTYRGPDAGPFVALGLAVGLLLFGSWQLRCFFKSWEGGKEPAAPPRGA